MSEPATLAALETKERAVREKIQAARAEKDAKIDALCAELAQLTNAIAMLRIAAANPGAVALAGLTFRAGQ